MTADQYNKLARAVFVLNITALNVAIVILKNWITLYGIPSTIMPDNSPQFVSKLFAVLCAASGSMLIITTGYSSQSNG